ncbi:hypothetical protein [Terriglobus saanensis]|uniref:Uncharacterized protein n=1 Tax=Terriglobus saanensis (strain ATCC BAA-1853 / DSM 23119 / SP1PR4) TaxID=401053 RepID=E8V0U7_TERSS|nr:hypothetical protein [Terriglobus saanensis]ADV82238.1 hypothetical protein AciPR4_1415 [Terriglobus saanensis SP1PR4]
MEVSRILIEIDAQISKLQQARALLTSTSVTATAPAKRGPGRPKGTVTVAAPTPKKAAKKAGKRNLSPDARKRIADAQKRRWAERRKQKAA